MKIIRTISYSVVLFGIIATPSLSQTDTPEEDVSVIEMSQRAAAFRKVIVSLESDIAVAQSALNETQTELETMRASLADAIQRNSNLREEEAGLIARSDTASSELQIKISNKAKMSDEIIILQEASSVLTQRISDLESMLEQKQADANSVLDEIKTDTEAATNALASLKEQFAMIEVATAEATLKRDRTLADVAETQARLEAESISTLASLNEQIAAAQADTDTAMKTRDDAIADAETARAELAAVQLSAEEASKIAAQTAAASAAVVQVTSVKLPPAQIRQALQEAPGINTATAAQKTEIEELLSQGVCAHDALNQVLGSVNRQTLASLIRSLGRC